MTAGTAVRHQRWLPWRTHPSRRRLASKAGQQRYGMSMDGGTDKQDRILTVANTVIAIFIAAALVVFGILGFVKDPPKAQRTPQRADANARLRDRIIDPKLLTQAEVFPQRRFTVASNHYTLLAQEDSKSCPPTARGD